MRALLVLRPEPGASITLGRARALGLSGAAHPLFDIRPVEWTLPEGDFDALLLTSANAVRHAGELPRLPVLAVGEATAAAARDAGLQIMATGSGGVAELLRDSPPALRLLHLAGAERMPSPPGANISAVTVYRAEPLTDPSAALVEGRVLLVHSPAAGKRVAAFDCDRARVRIAAISAEAAGACGPGWDRIAAAARPSDEALLSLAARLCKE